MRTFCTSIGSHQLFPCLALYYSLTRHVPGSTLWVLCLDQASERVLADLPLPGLRALPLAELETAEPRLRVVRPDRSQVEYHYTLTPALVWHLLTRVPDAGPVTLLDPDVYFFASAAPLIEEAGSGSIAIMPRALPESHRKLERFGRYSLSWLTFMDDRLARACLAAWRNRCMEWCRDRVEDGKFAHVRYLDDWPTQFEGVHILAYEGAGVAPWNVSGRPITSDRSGTRAGGVPLVFYQFRGCERILSWLFDPGLGDYGAELTPALRTTVYLPYLVELRAIEHDLRRTVPRLPNGWRGVRRPGLGRILARAFRRQLIVAA